MLTEELAKLVGVSPKTIAVYCRKGLLKAEKKYVEGRWRWLIPQDELEKARKLAQEGIRQAYYLHQPQAPSSKPAKHVCRYAKKVEPDLYYCPKYDVKLRSGAPLCLTCKNPREKFNWEAKRLFGK